jgi:cytosine/adenosine deaminase-related metal-dependent hydrolase
MKTLIRNSFIVAMNDQDHLLEKGSIVIDDNRFTYVGPQEWTPPEPYDRVIEADRMIAIPGLINAHCHSPANLVRGMMASRPLEIWRAYYRALLRGMRDDDFYASALLGGMEMLKSGTTTVVDHFFGNQACRFMGAGAAIEGALAEQHREPGPQVGDRVPQQRPLAGSAPLPDQQQREHLAVAHARRRARSDGRVGGDVGPIDGVDRGVHCHQEGVEIGFHGWAPFMISHATTWHLPG